MKLLIDMNLTPRWVAFLDDHGIEAAHWAGMGDVRADDAEIMKHGAAQGFTILTHDLDFGTILAATGTSGPSVIQIRGARPSPEMAGALVVRAIRELDSELDHGALVTVDAERVRVSMLPLRGSR